MKTKTLRIILILFAVVLFSSSPGIMGRVEAPNQAFAHASADSLADSSAERIRFERGATSAVVNGTLAANSSATYVLRALVGQLMEVTLTAPEGARLVVATSGGRALTPVNGSTTGFRGYLPHTGDYTIEIRSGSQAITYGVHVSIPVRVAFDPGTTSAILSGSLTAHQGRDYILRAQGGQLLEIEVSPSNSVQLIIYGFDGTVLRSGMGEGSSFRGELPSSQDYLVSVRAGEQSVSYTMSVIIPRRISFQRGAISGTEFGRVSANKSQYYVLRASKNQTMQVEVSSTEAVQLMIYGADGTVLKSGMGEGASFKGVLPSSQDYVVVLRAGANSTRYTLKVTIW